VFGSEGTRKDVVAGGQVVDEQQSIVRRWNEEKKEKKRKEKKRKEKKRKEKKRKEIKSECLVAKTRAKMIDRSEA
jgi:hypothetical protein